MIMQSLPLVNWNNGIFMIAIFGVVCVCLVVLVLLFINSDKKKEQGEDNV